MFKMRRIENGMMTVEASFVLPIVLFILILLLYFFFYCYESGVAAGILREEVLKLSDTIKTSGDLDTGAYDIKKLNDRKLSYLLNYNTGKLESQCKMAIQEKLSKQSLFGSNLKVEISVKHGKITGNITSNVKIPLLGTVEIGGISIFKVEQSMESEVRMPAEQIRRWQQIE